MHNHLDRQLLRLRETSLTADAELETTIQLIEDVFSHEMVDRHIRNYYQSLRNHITDVAGTYELLGYCLNRAHYHLGYPVKEDDSRVVLSHERSGITYNLRIVIDGGRIRELKYWESRID